jgi:hypothetical protein
LVASVGTLFLVWQLSDGFKELSATITTLKTSVDALAAVAANIKAATVAVAP